MELLNGKEVSALIKDEIREEIEKDFIDLGKDAPCLACVLVGDNPASRIYVSSKEKACASVKMNSVIKTLPGNATEDEVKTVLKELSLDEKISGILLQLPLPNGLNEREILECIDPRKDVDALTNVSLGRLFAGNNAIAPCTATGIIDILKHYNIGLEGKNVAVIGRSLLVGKSVMILFEQENATVTLCHSKTQNLEEITKNADILVVAIGKPKFVTENMVKNGAIVIDVGINRTDDGIVGDVDFENVAPKCSFITPVPGGVGPMTIAELLKNTLILHKNK